VSRRTRHLPRLPHPGGITRLGVGMVLAAAGILTLSASSPAASVSTWTIVPSPNTSPTQSNSLADVACSGPMNCMAVGSFTAANQATLTEHWNGSAWTIVPSPNGSATSYNQLNGVACASATTCVAVGVYSDGTNQFTLAEVWNGSTWTVTPSPSPSATDNSLGHVSCTSTTNCVAVGDYRAGSTAQTLVEQWNGSAWTVVPSPNTSTTADNYLQAVSCSMPASCFAVGQFQGATNTQTLAEQWDGSTWTIVTSPNSASTQNNTLNNVSCTNPSFCMAVGDYQRGVKDNPNLIEMWNGTSWAISPSPSVVPSDENDLYGVSCTGPANCVAAGHWSDPNDTTDQTQILNWNGTAWSLVSSPNSSPSLGNDLSGVTCTAVSHCIAVGGQDTAGPFENLILSAPIVASGYWEVASDGGMFSFHAPFYGSMGGKPLNKPIVGMAADAATGGYWEVASDGGMFSFNAPFYGSMGGKSLNKPIVGMAYDPATGGYWEVASDGGIFSFNAPFFGSTGGKTLNAPIVGIAALPDGSGYYEIAADGGLFAFNAPFLGSMGGKPLNKPIVGMAVDPATGGYWEVASDGGLFSFGAPFLGSMGGKLLNKPVVGMASQPDGSGYWEVASDGGLFSFGAPFLGSTGGTPLNQPVVGMAIS